MKITKYTNLVVVLQHLSDYSDLWMVVLDWYNPGEGQRVATNSVIHKHKIFLLLKKKKILIISDHLNLFVVSPHKGKLLDVTDSCTLAQNDNFQIMKRVNTRRLFMLRVCLVESQFWHACLHSCNLSPGQELISNTGLHFLRNEHLL